MYDLKFHYYYQRLFKIIIIVIQRIRIDGNLCVFFSFSETFQNPERRVNSPFVVYTR